MNSNTGIFVFETQYCVDVFENGLIDTIYHEHISYFNLTPLSIALRRHGLDIIHVRRIPTKGGSIRVTAAPIGAGRPVDPGVAALLAQERLLGYTDAAKYHAFAQAAEKLRARIRAALDDLVSAGGGHLAGYGASVGAITLLHWLGLTDRLSYIVDDKPLGDALSGPGYRIPIKPSSTLAADKPSATVLFAWRYADIILARNADYLAGGGRFVIPLPDLRIV